MSGKTTQIEIPKEWSDTYTDADRAAVARIIQYLAQRGLSQKWLAERTKMRSSLLNQILRGRYPSVVADHLALLEGSIRLDSERQLSLRKVPIVETSVYRAVNAACHRAHVMEGFAVISGDVGVGKTVAIKQYCKKNPGALLVEGDPDMTASVMLNELIKKLGAGVATAKQWSKGTKADRMEAVLRALEGSDRLIIFDEAERASPQTLEYLRRISDKAGVGVVLAGNRRLYAMLRSTEGRWGQVSSRVVLWPPTISSITRQDSDDVVTAALGQHCELTEEILDAFWQMCDGSMRVLAKGLLPGVVDYGVNKGHALSPELIFKVGQDVLGYKRRQGGRANV